MNIATPILEVRNFESPDAEWDYNLGQSEFSI